MMKSRPGARMSAAALAAMILLAGGSASAEVQIRHLFTYGSTDWDQAFGLALSHNPDAYVLGGAFRDDLTLTGPDGQPHTITSQSQDGFFDAFVMELDFDSDQFNWLFTMQGPGLQTAPGVRALSDGTYFVFGSARDFTTLNPVASGPSTFNTTFREDVPGVRTSDPFLSRLNGNGELMWFDSPNGSLSNFVIDGVEGPDNTTYFGGTTRKAITLNPAQPTELTLPRTTVPIDTFYSFYGRYDAQGRVIWGRILGGPGDDTVSRVLRTSDGGLIGVGTYRQSATVNMDEADAQTFTDTGEEAAYIVRWDQDGNLIYFMGHGGPGRERALGAGEIAGTDDFLLTGGYNEGAIFHMADGTTYTPPAEESYNIYVSRVDGDTGLMRWVAAFPSDAPGHIFGDNDWAWAAVPSSTGTIALFAAEYLQNVYTTDGTLLLQSEGLSDTMYGILDLETGELLDYFSVSGPGRNQPAVIAAVPGTNEFLVNGVFGETAFFNFGTSTEIRTSVGERDGYVLHLIVPEDEPPSLVDSWKLY